MYGYMVSDRNSIGFGYTREEAKDDLYINMCKVDLAADTKGLFTKRREILKPWLPKDNMLHIAKVGCIIYENGTLRNTKTNKSVEVTPCRYAAFYYLMSLCGNELSYTDILIALQPEVDRFFSNINKDFIQVRDLPPIKVLGMYSGFVPKVIYTLECGIVVGVSDTMIGLKRQGEELFHVVETEDGLFMIPLLAYIGSKLGYVFDEKGVKPYVEEVDEF